MKWKALVETRNLDRIDYNLMIGNLQQNIVAIFVWHEGWKLLWKSPIEKAYLIHEEVNECGRNVLDGRRTVVSSQIII